MEQLVQLQESYDEFKQRDAEVIVVFREEEDGVEGLERSRERADAQFPLAVAPDAEATAPYSRSGFDTYVIDDEGVIQAVLGGTLADRPAPAEILDHLPPVEG